MIIANHNQLTEYIASRLSELPLLANNEVPVVALGSLDKDVLTDFLARDTAVGLYIHGGTFQQHGLVEEEEVSLAVVIGCRNYATETASLTGSNISAVTNATWRNILVRADLAVLGLDVKITLARPLPDHNLQEVYGAGY